jgi:hypothetical protein
MDSSVTLPLAAGLGAADGATLGAGLGAAVGARLGTGLGASETATLGAAVAVGLGARVGAGVAHPATIAPRSTSAPTPDRFDIDRIPTSAWRP